MILGVDVSHWDGNVDWAKAIAAGAQFAYIKAGEGSIPADNKFAQNWAATKGKLPRGAYWFWRYASDPVQQAQRFAAIVGEDNGELPPVLDLEDSAAPQMAADLPAKMRACLAEVERIWKWPVLVYTGAWWWNAWVSKPGCMADRELWVAHYTTGQPILPHGWTTFRLHQFSADHNGQGAKFGTQSSDVDINRFNGDDFTAWSGAPVPLTMAQKVDILWDWYIQQTGR